MNAELLRLILVLFILQYFNKIEFLFNQSFLFQSLFFFKILLLFQKSTSLILLKNIFSRHAEE